MLLEIDVQYQREMGKDFMMLKIRESIQRRESMIMFILACGVMLWYCLVARVEVRDVVPTYATYAGHEGEEQFIYYLTDDDVIEQEFASSRNFDMVTLHLSDHDKVISGKTSVSVIEKDTNKPVYNEEISNSDIIYGRLLELKFDGNAGTSYVLKLTFEGMGNEGLGIFGFPIQNGGQENYEVAVGIHIHTNLFQTQVVRVLFFIFILLVINVILVTQTKLTEEYLFLGIVIPVGIAFLSFLSVNAVHDGGTHLAKVYHYSNVLMGRADSDTNSQVLLREDEAQAYNEIYEENHRENPVMETYFDTVERFWEKTEEQDYILSHEYRATIASSIFEYFPGTLGMTLGRILGRSVRFNIFLAKLFCFMFYVVIVFWAIKISPYFKSVIAFAALLPMSLYQATGITYDSVVMAISLLILALFFRARTERLSSGEIIILFVASATLGCCKGGFYLVILLAFLTISKEQFGGLKNKCKLCVGSLLAGGIGMLVTFAQAFFSSFRYIQAGALETDEIATLVPGTENAAYGIKYVFTNSIGFLKILVVTLTHKTEQYIGTLIGNRMKWTDTLVSWHIILAFIILLILAGSRTEKIQVNVNVKERILLALCLGIEIIGFHLLMLIETPVWSQVIEGVQGRYFLPWVPIIILIIYNGKRKYELQGMRRMFFYYAIAESAYLYSFLKIFLSIA